MIVSRPATRSDVHSFYGCGAPVTIQARVWERENEILAIAGWFSVAGQRFVFSDLKEGTRVAKKTIWREAKAFMADLPACVCACSPGSEKFLLRLGWHPTEDGVFEWQS